MVLPLLCVVIFEGKSLNSIPVTGVFLVNRLGMIRKYLQPGRRDTTGKHTLYILLDTLSIHKSFV